MTTETVRTPAPPQDAPPAYFLSLTVENFRCFGPPQTLDLSRGENRPAPWTIILGENGVGKTTLLQCLAAYQPEKRDIRPPGNPESHFFVASSSLVSAALGIFPLNKTTYNKGRIRINCTICVGNDIQVYPLQSLNSDLVKITGEMDSNYYGHLYENIDGLNCYGYGASRRMGKSSLSEQRTEDTAASLFSDDVDLINAEEWLLQADYAASRAPKSNTRAAKRRDQVIGILKALLPDVDNMQFGASED